MNDAVLRGVDLLNVAKEQNTLPENSTSIILLLTDGDPTKGMSVLVMIFFVILCLLLAYKIN